MLYHYDVLNMCITLLFPAGEEQTASLTNTVCISVEGRMEFVSAAIIIDWYVYCRKGCVKFSHVV